MGNFNHPLRFVLYVVNLAFFFELSLQMMNPVNILLLLCLKLSHSSGKPLLGKVNSCQHLGFNLFMLFIDFF